jgi:hypothetical protein
MNAVEQALRDFLAVRPSEVAVALVGGLAVSARVEPRFTRDLDFAVAVASDDEAAQYVFRMRQLGYEIVTALEQTARGRLSTIRLRRGGRGPIVDLLFAACGIEVEIAQAAEPMEIAAGVVADVAQVGHLIAMKLVSRDPKRRPRDQQDLVDLAGVADDHEWKPVSESLGDHDVDVAIAVEQGDADVVRVALDHEIDARSADLQRADREAFEARRQDRPVEHDARVQRVDLEAEAGLEQQEHRAGRPRLRCACDRIVRRPLVRPRPESAEQLRHAPQIEVERGVVEGAEQARALALVAVAGEAHGDQRVVVRPHRAVVI